MTKLAVRKEECILPGSGFYYRLHPLKMEHDMQAAVFQQMGYIIISVDDKKAERLLESAREALGHEVEVAWLTEKRK